MAVLSKEAFLEAIKNKVGDSTEEEDITFIENMTDTYDSMNTKANNNEAEGWKTKYEDLQKKYKERFFSGTTELPEDNEEDKPHILTFDNLFKEN